MRFCPFCSAENAAVATHCGTCARRLPPLPPRRRTSSGDDPGDGRSRRGSSDGGAMGADELARVAPGPAARRRTRAPEVRVEGEPARRKTNLPQPSRGLREPIEEDVGRAPPAPSRQERDRAASARASREMSVNATAGRAPSPAAPPIPKPPARAVTPAAPRAQPVPAPSPDNGRLPRAPAGTIADEAETVITRAAPEPPPAEAARDYDTEPVPGDEDDHEWPDHRPVAPDPDDWSEEAQHALADVPRTVSPPPPTPPPRADSSRYTPARPSSPPPTRVGRLPGDAFKPPPVKPIPEVPESGLFNAAAYALSFAKARWQRRSAIRSLSTEIQDETTELDTVLGLLGKEARSLHVDNRVLAAENAAIGEAEERRVRFDHECAELGSKAAEENSRFGDLESERQAKVDEAEAELDKAQRELGGLEAQRRSLRENRKAVERRQRGLLKAADERDEQAAKASMGDTRGGLRRAAEELRRDAAALDPERQDLDRRLSALEKPISKSAATVESLKAEHDSARRSLNDAREGHRHRLAELEAEQGRKSRELSQAEAEIQRRLVTLGTLVNLHRIERPEFDDMYARIDGLRAAIGARSTEIDRLTAEREAYDKASLVRGFLVIGGGVVVLITLIVILLSVW